MQATRIRIGTRGSPLALAQAHEVKNRIMAAHGLGDEAVSVHAIKTTGDRVLDRSLSEIGGKGLFTKEIEEALLAREDPRDAFISLRHETFATLPENAVVGTSSLRRKAQVLHARPDLRVVEFRGNVQTRLRKLEDGVAEATFLAVAGLKRLGLQDRITSPVAMDHMLPAVAQGAIALEIRDGDEAVIPIVAALNDENTAWAVAAERAFLERLEGSCRTPIAGHGVVDGRQLHFRGQLLSPDGAKCFDVSRRGPVEEAREFGLSAADEILSHADAALLVGSNA